MIEQWLKERKGVMDMPVYKDGRPQDEAQSTQTQTAVSNPTELETLPYNNCDTIFLCSEKAFYYFDAASVLAPSPPSVIIPDDITPPDPGRWLPVPLPVAPGAAGDVRATKVSFTFATPSPLTLVPVTAGDIVIDAEIVIEIPFNGTNPTLSVGDTADAQRYIPTTQNDPKTIGNYGSQTNYEYVGIDTVRLTIVPDGSTAGAGYILITYKDA